MVSPQEVALRWFREVWDNRNDDAIRELLAPDAPGHLEGGVDIVGAEPFIVFRKSILEALPDLRVEVVKCIGDEGNACVMWKATACHSGTGMGFLPTGKTVSFRGMTWLRVENGRIMEGWDHWNQEGLMSVLAGKA